MKNIAKTFFGINNLDSQITNLFKNFLIVELTRLVAFNISGMFIILYLLDTLESTQVGILFALNYLILSLVDYPTGVLGDVIGYRKVMLIAYFFFICSYFLLIFSNSFIPLLIYSAFSAIATSQESGALESWFDNNYQSLSINDPERKIYNSFQARKSLISQICYGLSFIIGGLIAQYISRQFLFGTSLIGFIVVFFLIILFIRDDSSKKVTFTSEKYYRQFIDGIKFLISSKGIFLYLVGSTVIWAANNSIWYNFILFPTYENYSGGQDNLTALFRATIFATGVFWSIFIIRYISKIKNIKGMKWWILITTTLSNTIFFLAIYIYYSIFPPINYEITLLIGLFIIFQLPGMWENLEYILRNRLNLDLVPDDIRNGIYSLLPTITTIIGIPGSLLGGIFLSDYGFVPTILVVVLVSSFGVVMAGIGLYWLPEVKNRSSNNKEGVLEMVT